MATPSQGRDRRSSRRSNRRRYIRRAFAIAAVVAVAAFAAVAFTLLAMGRDLRAGRDEIRAGQRALLSGDIARAQEAFGSAELRLGAAAERTDGWVGRMATWVPLLGDDVDVTTALARAGTHVAGGGLDMSAALATLPDGVDSLAPSGGRIPVENYASLSDAVSSAADEAEAAVDALRAAPTSAVLPPVRDARSAGEYEAERAARTLEAAGALIQGLPGFVGDDRPQRYLLLTENPAELRGTGGIWGAYAIVTFREGAPAFSDVSPVLSLPQLAPEEVPAPSSDYARNYDEFGGAASWQNMNMTPDFPSAARAAIANFEEGGGASLDGVLVATPHALESMLRFTGTVSVPGIDFTVDASNVVDFTANQAYSLFERSVERKAVLGAVATRTIERFLAMEGRGLARLRALGDAAIGGDLKVYSTDAVFQRGLELAGAAGAFDAPPGDVLAVTLNNGSGSKVDYYAERTVSYDVTLGGEGQAIGVLTTAVTNEAPTEGAPRYVIGPFLDDAQPGDQIAFWSVSCHDPCDLATSERDGEAQRLDHGSELGIPWFRDYRTIPSGQEGTLELSWFTQDVWQGNSSGGVYRLTFLDQPTIQPTRLDVTIHAPEGTTVEWTNVPMAIDGGQARWTGTPTSTTELQVRFSAPLPLRWWRNVSRALS